MKRSEILASQTFSPVQVVVSLEDTKWGKEAGKVIDHGARAPAHRLTPAGLCTHSLDPMNPDSRPKKAQGPPGLLIPVRVYTASVPFSLEPCHLHRPEHTQVVALSSRAPGHGPLSLS